jgi:hypothetical protein
MKAMQFFLVTVWIFSMQANNISTQPFAVKAVKVTISGTSTMHDWESDVEKVDCKGSFTIVNNKLDDIRDVVVKIPVTSIKSPKGKMMDNKTYEAFNYEKYPFIVFTLNSKKVNENNGTIDLKGTLSMAGVAKGIEVTASYKLLQKGDLHITGSKKLTMSDFKMEPPTAMMGAIKVADDVVVNFDITLSTNNSI